MSDFGEGNEHGRKVGHGRYRHENAKGIGANVFERREVLGAGSAATTASRFLVAASLEGATAGLVHAMAQNGRHCECGCFGPMR